MKGWHKTTALQIGAIVAAVRTLGGWSLTKTIAARTHWSALTVVQRLRQAEAGGLVQGRRAGQSLEWRLAPDESNGPRDDVTHPTDGRLRRYVYNPPPHGAVFMDCDEADELPFDESCLGCPGWGYECWAWWLPPPAGEVRS